MAKKLRRVPKDSPPPPLDRIGLTGVEVAKSLKSLKYRKSLARIAVSTFES